MFGRRYVLLIAMCSYTILFVGQGVATNIQTVLILRFFSGAFAVAPLITSGGMLLVSLVDFDLIFYLQVSLRMYGTPKAVDTQQVFSVDVCFWVLPWDLSLAVCKSYAQSYAPYMR